MRLHLYSIVATSFLAAAPVWAQTNQISGSVSDTGGARIPGCDVTVTSVHTGLKRAAQTDGNGLFIFPSLPAGTYDVRAEIQGFRPSQKSGVVLDAASRRVVDFKLELGSFSAPLPPCSA